MRAEPFKPLPADPSGILGRKAPSGPAAAPAGGGQAWRRMGEAAPSATDLRTLHHGASGSRPPAGGTPRSGTKGREPATEQPLVIIVDDDAEMRLALEELMLSVGLDTLCFSSTRDLLAAELPDRPGCLILDVRMPGLSGLDLQRHLASSDRRKPIVFLTAHGDIPMTVQAMKAGAIDFLTKPHRDQALLDAIAVGIEADTAQRASARISGQHAERLRTLTSRERQVLRQLVQGRLNKQIAYDLGISDVTVKVHRGNVMRKIKANSVADLIRAWEAAPATLRETEAA
jgi:FixJ family two-component response regulator